MILQIGLALIGFFTILSAILGTKFGAFIAISLFSTSTLFIVILFLFWLGIKPIFQMAKKREKPGRFTEVKKVRKDGVIYNELMDNPKEVKFESVQATEKAIIGTQIIGTFHRDGDFGNPIHYVFEGEAQNSNLLDAHAPTIDSKLADATMVQVWHAGAMDMAAELQQKNNLFSLQNVLIIIAVAGVLGTMVIAFQNQELLKTIMQAVADLPGKIPAGAGRIVSG